LRSLGVTTLLLGATPEAGSLAPVALLPEVASVLLDDVALSDVPLVPTPVSEGRRSLSETTLLFGATDMPPGVVASEEAPLVPVADEAAGVEAPLDCIEESFVEVPHAASTKAHASGIVHLII